MSIFAQPTAMTWGIFEVTNCPSSVSITDARIRSAFESAEKELGRYKRYHYRWDGYQAEPFSQDVLGRAAAILGYSQDEFLNAGVIPAMVTTGPAPDGSVDVELQVAEKRLLMTLYPEQEQVKLSSFEHDEVVDEHGAAIGEKTVADWIAWLNQPSNVQVAVAANSARPR
jgi:hypothetical protein